MKIEPRLPQLPSLAELLEHPRVNVLVERINRSTIARRAGGFLEEIRASLAQRAGRVELPSLGHLAERLARRLLGETASGPEINATGLLFGDGALALPLAEPALHAMLQLASDFHSRDHALAHAAERGVCELAGGDAAHVASSFEAALTLTVAATAGNREVQVYGDLDAPGPVDWRWLAARASAALVSSHGQVGDAAAIVRAPDADAVALATLSGSKPRGACLIDAAPLAGVLDPAAHGYESVPTIADRLRDGADLVVIDGAGLLGGPACGLVIGRRQFVDAISRHPLASLLAAEPLEVAALEAVLKVHRDGGRGAAAIYQLPVWQLISAPAENLEQRAQRLATLLGDSPGITSAEARNGVSVWRRWGAREWTAPTWCVDVRCADDDQARSLQLHLAHGSPPIAARLDSATVQLDLRTVFPRWDQQLVSGVENWRGPAVSDRGADGS